jgi:GWxTD domain-containing protein
VGVWLGVGSAPGWAQDGSSRTEQFEAGQSAFEAGRYEAARQRFRAIVEARPVFRRSVSGAAAWWLGRSHAALGDSADAHTAWRAGVSALDAAGTLDVRLLDAYIRSVFARRLAREYDTAAMLYLRLIEAAGTEVHPADRVVVRRHVAQMLPLLPTEKRVEVAPNRKAFQRGEGTLRPNVGKRLAAWWRLQDPIPATGRNERVIEHLQRVTVAERRYATDRTAAGFDDRGRIYVRLGAPSDVVQLDNEAITEDGLCPFCPVILTGGAFVPGNEYWIYADLGPYAQYLFVKRKGQYRLGTVRDLLPPEIRGPTYSPSDPPSSILAGEASGGQPQSLKAGLALKVLRAYYKQMVRYQPDYLHLLNDIEQVLLRNLGMGSGPLDTATPPSVPVTVAGSRVNDVGREDRRLSRERASTVPAVRSGYVDRGNQLPVAVRTARFLDGDGTTRTEVYWAVDPADLAPIPADQLHLMQQGLLDPEQYLLRLTSVRYGLDDASRTVARTDYRIDADRDEPVVYSLMLPAAHRRYHLALQWDQYAAASDSAAAFMRRGTIRVDSLQPLPSAKDRLTLSDLVPLRAERLADVRTVRGATGFTLPPYPYDYITPDTQLALYLEAYHLAVGADDRTRYSVEYRIERQVLKGGVRGWLGATEEEATIQATTYQGTTRTAREYIALDLSPYTEASRLRITVRVTDEVTGQQAERTIRFGVARGESQSAHSSGR